ncbi:DinB family protein [Streptomyces sp. SCA3-4]|uniref:DinB family protein n=1 Tax=Streptomyces sichuanensis TaxID=2871810 RepID=UPI001CE2AEBA|nr:DinB family protein [Streptomyces sichuanensis]MCA6092278.1 DinB family protein [Streptomyces sichuanensis]
MPTHVIEKNVSDERGTLLDFLEAQRGGMRRSVLGLTAEQAAAVPSASELSLHALLKHTIQAESNWIERARGAQATQSFEEAMEGWQAGWKPTEEETVAVLLARWAEVAAETERFIRSVPLEDTFALPEAPWFPKGNVSMRWVMLHLIEEVARHAGHADVIRESIDGKTAFELVDEEGRAGA